VRDQLGDLIGIALQVAGQVDAEILEQCFAIADLLAMSDMSL
jgi:hypothetical protein